MGTTTFEIHFQLTLPGVHKEWFSASVRYWVEHGLFHGFSDEWEGRTSDREDIRIMLGFWYCLVKFSVKRLYSLSRSSSLSCLACSSSFIRTSFSHHGLLTFSQEVWKRKLMCDGTGTPLQLTSLLPGLRLNSLSTTSHTRRLSRGPLQKYILHLADVSIQSDLQPFLYVHRRRCQLVLHD